ncbi:MAG: hypothetical protein KIS63_17660, partial [Caldilineales bacterium]|nr:hypothetical protein [Caldilineales bacterium]
MSFIRALPRLLFFLATVAAIAAIAWVAGQWTRSQSAAYRQEGSDAKLVRNVNAPWRTLNPDTIEDQALQFYLNLNRGAIETPVDANAEPMPFHVALGETGFDISQRLEDLGLIRNASLFRL